MPKGFDYYLNPMAVYSSEQERMMREIIEREANSRAEAMRREYERRNNQYDPNQMLYPGYGGYDSQQSSLGGAYGGYIGPIGLSGMQYFVQYSASNTESVPSSSESVPSSSSVAVIDEPSRDMLERVQVEAPDVDSERARLAKEAVDVLGYTPLASELKLPSELRKTLAKLEIEILDEVSVNKYKAQMVEHYRTANKMLSPTWRITELSKYKQPVPEYVLSKAIEIKRELPAAMFYIDQLAVDPFLIVSMVALNDHMVNRERQLDPEMSAYLDVWSEPKFEGSM